jgi:L-rhamnose mutarotase
MKTIDEKKELLIKEIDLFLSNKDNFKEVKNNISEYSIFEISNNRLFLFLNIMNTQHHIEKIEVIKTWMNTSINIYFKPISRYTIPIQTQPKLQKIEILKRDFIPLILSTFSVMELFYIKILFENYKKI